MALSLGQRLTRVRKQKGVQQNEAADQGGITRGRLSQLENDYERGPDINQIRSTLARLAAYYDVMVEYFLAGTPQEYMQAFVAKHGHRPDLTTAGRRLQFVLGELQLRWGEEFSEERIASELGMETDALRGYLQERAIMSDEPFIERLAELTGAPMDFLVPRLLDGAEGEAGLRRVINMAAANGITAEELELLIQGYLTARSIRKKPSE